MTTYTAEVQRVWLQDGRTGVYGLRIRVGTGFQLLNTTLEQIPTEGDQCWVTYDSRGRLAALELEGQAKIHFTYSRDSSRRR
jgi:hypothetical protein